MIRGFRGSKLGCCLGGSISRDLGPKARREVQKDKPNGARSFSPFRMSFCVLAEPWS